MRTRITELLGVEAPVIQGGMAHIADARLAAAVSEAGASASSPAEARTPPGSPIKCASRASSPTSPSASTSC